MALVFNTPHPVIEGADCRVTLTVDQAIKHMKKAYPSYKTLGFSNIEILMDFLVIHQARWEKDDS